MMNNAPQTNLPEEIMEEDPTGITAPLAAVTEEEVQDEAADSVISSLAPRVLTSEEDLARIKPYMDLLKKTIDQAGITNIALTGNYGSGKSTLINTFLSQHTDYGPLRISLASFGNVAEKVAEEEAEIKTSENPVEANMTPLPSVKKPVKSTKDSKATKEKKEELERLLEVSILQQIFYHVKPSAIPDSRFKRITNIKDGEIFWIAFSFVLWVVSAVILFKFDYINRINPSSWHTSLSFDWLALPVFLIFFAGVGVFAKNIVRLLNNSKINKVNIKGELELGDKLDKSVFNEHLEEILYFFERTKFNLVVIEDLDRFDSTDIFTKLRELNTLLNNSLSIKERKDHREIVFLYAISDETFKDKNERVKFFEYIIPVIPFINPSNAGEQLGKLIREAKIEDARFKEFTEDLVTFIDDIDMRLLINIFHEYQLYRDNLSAVLEQDKLFAIITYKNMFPEDFSKLHSRKGILYEFLSGRSKYVKKMTDAIELQLSDNLRKLGNIASLKVGDVDGLKALYIKEIYQQFPRAIGINIGGRINFSDLLEDENFKAFSELARIEYAYLDYNNSYGMYQERFSKTNVSFKDLEETVNPGFTFVERRQHILDASDGIEQELKKENDQLRSRKQDVESWSLAEIFEEVDIDPFIKEFSDSGLIRNLLLNGYIDENYSDYISLFHQVNMTAEDFVFEKQVKSGTVSAFDYKLSSTPYLIKKLHEKYFKREVILNLDLVCVLLQEEVGFNEKRAAVFDLLANEKARSIRFIDEFISKRTDEAAAFVKLLAAKWPGCWNYLEKRSGYAADKLDNYLRLLISSEDIEHLLAQGPLLNSYISGKADFLRLFKTDEEKAAARIAIEKLGIKFNRLQPATEETQMLFDFVYNNSCYQINADNILLMLAEKAEGISEEQAIKSNYSAVQQSGCEPLRRYVGTAINSYVKNVFLKIAGNTDEQEQYELELLNNANLKEELKVQMIEEPHVMIEDISKVNSFDIQKLLVENDRMEVIWKNVFNYYDVALAARVEGEEDVYFDETLLRYLNQEQHYNVLSRERLGADGSRDDQYCRAFAVRLMGRNELDQKAYEALMKANIYSYVAVDFAHLDRNKVEWLVEEGRLGLNKHNFEMLKEHFPDLHIRELEVKESYFAQKTAELALDEDDVVSLLSSIRFSIANKLLVYKELDEETIIGNADISRLTCGLLSTQRGISLSFGLIESMIKHSHSIEDCIKLINIHFSSLSQDQVKSLIRSLGGDYPEIFESRKQPKLPALPSHEELFAKLKSEHMIRDFDLYEKDHNKFKVKANY